MRRFCVFVARLPFQPRYSGVWYDTPRSVDAAVGTRGYAVLSPVAADALREAEAATRRAEIVAEHYAWQARKREEKAIRPKRHKAFTPSDPDIWQGSKAKHAALAERAKLLIGQLQAERALGRRADETNRAWKDRKRRLARRADEIRTDYGLLPEPTRVYLDWR